MKNFFSRFKEPKYLANFFFQLLLLGMINDIGTGIGYTRWECVLVALPILMITDYIICKKFNIKYP